MVRNNMLVKAVPILLCASWGLLLIPLGPVGAENNQKACNQPWDCQQTCRCSNFQVNVGSQTRYCYRVCTEKIQNINKNQCQHTGSANDNCVDTMNNCGQQRTNQIRVKISPPAVCTPNDYGNWTNCNNNWSPVDALGCD